MTDDLKNNSECWSVHSSSTLCLFPPPPLSHLTAASSFSFCRASLEHTVSAEELSYQLPRRTGGSNLTWHDGRGQKTAHTRTVKLLQQPGTEGIQVNRCVRGSDGVMRPAFKCVLSLQTKLWTRESRWCGVWKAPRLGSVSCVESFCSNRRDRRDLWCISITSPVFAVTGSLIALLCLFVERPVLTWACYIRWI